MKNKKVNKVTKVRSKRKNAIIENLSKGVAVKDVCKNVGINPKTFYEWIKIDKQFAKDIRQADELKIKTEVELVKTALLKRACGYEYTEIHRESGPKGITNKTIIKQVAPDTGAIVFYLCNRDKDNFKNTQKIEHSNDPDNPIGVIINGVNLEQYPGMKDTGKKGKRAK